ncbi:MAG: hypothetical protein KH452_01565 [Clostridiales bacterium]|nr:hypothetical protein [Clostridiales bacterium]
MFRVSLDQMKKQQTDMAEFSEKIHRACIRLEAQKSVLREMDSFSEIAAWLGKTEEMLQMQAVKTKELGDALEAVIRFYRNCEENILEHLENGPAGETEEVLIFSKPEHPGRWADFLEF